MNRIERVVVDECVGQESPLLGQLCQRLGERPVGFVFLASEHSGIPDIEILDKLMDARSALLTQDRVLHNLAIRRGFRSLYGFLSAHQLKQFRTKRRRICAHFGSPDNIMATALTIGQRRTAHGMVGGYMLKVDARHAVKSLFPASEGYFLDDGNEPLNWTPFVGPRGVGFKV